MDWHHPDRENLFRLVLGSSSPEEAHRIERHLAKCRDCREAVDEIGASLGPRLLDSWLLPGYDEAFENAADRASERLNLILQETPTAEALLAELLRRPAAGRRSLVQREERFHTLKLCQLLEARSRDLWTSDPFAALDCAELAAGIAGRLSPLRYGTSVVEDARAVAWGYFANSCRVCSDFWRAEQALLTAWRHHVLAGEDAYTEGELLSFTASLRTAQGRFDEAALSIDRAIAIYRESQDRHLEGTALIKKGTALGNGGKYLQAIRLIREGLLNIDGEAEPQVVLAGQHNLIFFTSDGGAPNRAREVLEGCRPLYQDAGDAMHRVRLRWLEGKIARDLGQLRKAEIALSEARETFVGYGLLSDAAFISLDLATLYANSNRRLDLLRVTREAIPLFESCGLRREAFLSGLLF